MQPTGRSDRCNSGSLRRERKFDDSGGARIRSLSTGWTLCEQSLVKTSIQKTRQWIGTVLSASSFYSSERSGHREAVERQWLHLAGNWRGLAQG
ncbi:hypothetical protein CEXT_561571 [Caerostris extrusa]|uniref:Uncharacterized protein n=1 Tax=Caerostris extrusa TaxID=172846 RepID=A0AAV4WLL3_CAEEX|nr:hypothetical protein CEXT_561571 [Caerostris extrusa]